MEQLAFPKDSGGQRGREVGPAIELACGPNQDVGCNPSPPQRRISDPAAAKFRRRMVWHDDHDVVVTALCVATCSSGARRNVP